MRRRSQEIQINWRSNPIQNARPIAESWIAWLDVPDTRQGRLRKTENERLGMKGDTLASGAKSAQFPPAKITQKKWDLIFGKKTKKAGK
jgi:hypothetical protein